MAISDEAKGMAAKFGTLRGHDLVTALASSLNQLLEGSYDVVAKAEDEGGESPNSLLALYTRDRSEGLETSGSKGRLAAVVDTIDCLDDKSLAASFKRISEVKSTQNPALAERADGKPQSDTTLGAIYAGELGMPMSALIEHFKALSGSFPSISWPDVIVIGDVGTIDFGVQFPGEGGIAGAFLPPAHNAINGGLPAIFVVLVERPPAAFAYNRFLSFLFGHLALFDPDAPLRSFQDFLEGAPKTAVIASGYQYNLAGELRPVPRDRYNDRLSPERPLEILDSKGRVLSTIGFMTWQDGGAVWLNGKLPLEGILVFMPGDIPFKTRVIRRESGMQASCVLPINEQHFEAMLQNFMARSNMRVRKRPQKWVVQKMADEGTTSPFVARLMLGIYRLRDGAFIDNELEREKFDTPFDQTSSSLVNARAAAAELARLWNSHSQKVASGEIVEMGHDQIKITETVTKELRREAESFLNSAVRTIKFGLQNLAKVLDIDLSFLFQQRAAYERGVAALEAVHPQLSQYIQRVRLWSEPLIEARNAIEHFGWMLPNVEYRQVDGAVKVIEPKIAEVPATSYTAMISDRLCCFIEDFTAFALSRKFPDGILLVEIPRADRLAEAPERFRLEVSFNNAVTWQMTYSEVVFEER